MQLKEEGVNFVSQIKKNKCPLWWSRSIKIKVRHGGRNSKFRGQISMDSRIQREQTRSM